MCECSRCNAGIAQLRQRAAELEKQLTKKDQDISKLNRQTEKDIKEIKNNPEPRTG